MMKNIWNRAMREFCGLLAAHKKAVVPLALFAGVAGLTAIDTQIDLDPQHSFFSRYKDSGKPEAWKYVFDSDEGHETAAAFEFAANETTLRLFTADGGRFIFLELLPQMQPAMDDLYDGKISLETYVKTGLPPRIRFTFSDQETTNRKLNAVGRMILNGKKRGIRVYAADIFGAHSPPELIEALQTEQEFKKVRNSFLEEWKAQHPGQEEQAHANGTTADIIATQTAEISRRYPDLYSKFLEADRYILAYRSDDHPLKGFIHAHAGNHRSMVVFGGIHLAGKHPNSLRSLLEAEGIAAFNVYPDPQLAAEKLGASCVDKDKIVPKYGFIVSTGVFSALACKLG